MILSMILLTACEGPKTGYTGHSTHEYMALDGTRSWRYVNDGTDYQLNVEKLESQMVGDTEVVTLEYAEFDPYLLLGSIQWSSDSSDGIMIHGYSVEGQDSLTFDPPILVADYQMVPGEVSTTETGGSIFLSTFDAVETCPNEWVDDDWECLKFTITTESGVSTYPFVGTWWLANAWGPSRFIAENGPFSASSEWILSQAQWSGGE